MTRPFVTASGIDRAIACPASASLPRVETGSVHATRGTEIHAFLAEALAGEGREAGLTMVSSDTRHTCEAIDLDEIRGECTALMCEIAFGLNVFSGQVVVVGTNVGRAYPKVTERGWIFGSVDIVGVKRDWLDEPSLMIADAKTGALKQTPARRNHQLRFAAICAATVIEVCSGSIELLYIDEHGGQVRDKVDFTGADIDAWKAELRECYEVWELAATDPATFARTGEHCGYCGSKPYCPRYAEDARRLATLDDAWLDGLDGLLDDGAIAGEILALIMRSEKVIEMAWEKIDAKNRLVPIRLPDGRVRTAITQAKRKIDQERALEVIRAACGEELALRCVTPTMTLSRIEKVGGDGLVSLLTERGAITVERNPSFKMVKEDAA